MGLITKLLFIGAFLGAGDLPHPRLNMNRISASRLMLRGLELGKIVALEGIYKVPTGM